MPLLAARRLKPNGALERFRTQQDFPLPVLSMSKDYFLPEQRNNRKPCLAANRVITKTILQALWMMTPSSTPWPLIR